MKRALAAAVLVLASGAAALEAVATRHGFEMGCAEAQVSNMTSVIVCVPPFREKHFYNVADPVELINSADAAEIVQTGDKTEVEIKEYSVRPSAGGSLLLALTAELRIDDPTDLENTLLVTPDYLLSGADFTAVTAKGERIVGVVPARFEGAPRIVHIVEDAVKAEFRNKLGTLTLEVVTGPGFTVGDRRGVMFEQRRGFWIGHQVAMKRGEPYQSVVRLAYVPSPDLVYAEPENRGGKPAFAHRADAATDYNPPLPLLPVPKSIVWHDGVFSPGRNLALSVSCDDPRLRRAAEKFASALPEAGGGKLDMTVVPGMAGEAYTLTVTPSGAAVAAGSARAAFYALQTLKALRVEAGFRCAEISDSPDFQLRAVHYMLPDRDSYKLLSRMVEDVMVPMKFNTLILECEFVQWESIPELNMKWGMSKADCEKLIALCEENFITPVPLLQTLSHVPWLFQNGMNRDLAEDLRNPYCYYTGNPRLYPMMEKLLDEIMDTFHNPEYIHIGHDELYTWAEFPCQPESKAKGAPLIVLEDVMWYYNYAKKRNAGIMMWHDAFVTPVECEENGHGGGSPGWVDRIRPFLPRDIVFCAARYSGKPSEFLDIRNLAAEGFAISGASWFEPDNVENLAMALKASGALGQISSTWIYPEMDGEGKIVTGSFDALEKWFCQLAPYVRTGAWSWNCDPAVNRFSGGEVFDDLLERSRNTGTRSGTLIDLSGCANLAFAGGSKPLLTGELYGIDAIGSVPVRAGRVLFKPCAAAVAVKSRLTPRFPEQVTIPVDGMKCSRFNFLHTAVGIQPLPETAVAEYVVTYADGTAVSLPARYQREVAPPEEEVNYPLSTGNSVRLPGGGRIWYAAYENPHPGKELRSITLKPTGNHPFLLLAVTLED